MYYYCTTCKYRPICSCTLYTYYLKLSDLFAPSQCSLAGDMNRFKFCGSPFWLTMLIRLNTSISRTTIAPWNPSEKIHGSRSQNIMGLADCQALSYNFCGQFLFCFLELHMLYLIRTWHIIYLPDLEFHNI